MIVRGFDTKAALFDKAVAEPFRKVFDEYIVKLERRSGGQADMERLTRDYIESLFVFLTSHRDVGRALVSAYLFEAEATEQIESPFTEVLARLDMMGEAALAEGGITSVPVGINIRVVLGMVVSMALLPDLFFGPGHRRPATSRIVDEMVAMMWYGNTTRPQT
jgi:hypothetical protein